MARTMSTPVIPQTDSIQELARFWDTQDLTDFEDELEEVTEPVFDRENTVTIQLKPEEIKAVNDLAKSKGVDSAALIREWVLEKVQVS